MDVPTQPGPSALQSTTPVADKGLVLVVDDHEATLYALTRTLEARGFRVVAAPSGQQAVAALRTLVPSFALIDANMPDMDGLSLLSWIKSQHHLVNVPVILCSAGLAPTHIQRALDLGALYVQKLEPRWFDLPEFLMQINLPSAPSIN